MRIAFFTDFVAPPQNGVWSSIINLSSTLCELGHKVIIFTPKPTSKKSIKLVDDRITIKFLPSIPGFLYPDLRLGFPANPALIKKIKALNVDIIHVHSQLSVGLGGIFIGKMLKIPIISTQHNYAMEEDFLEIINVHYMTKQVSSFLWKYTSFFLNQSDQVIAPTKMIKNDLLRHKIHPPVTVLPNTIQAQEIKKVDPSTLQALKKRLRLADRVVLFVGRLSKEKSIDILLESFSRVVKNRDDVSLLIIGDGPESTSLKKITKRFSLSEKVIFTGEIDQEQLLTKGYYQLADLFATASMTEVQPVSLIEAFYFGLPVVAPAKLGAYEMIKNVGLLCKPNNREDLAKNILRILENTTLQKLHAKKSLDEFRRLYDPFVITKQYVTLCKEVARLTGMSPEKKRVSSKHALSVRTI